MERSTLRTCASLALVAFALVGAPSLADTINFQGQLRDSGGNVWPGGQAQLTFRIYNAPEGGSPIEVVVVDSVKVTGGFASTTLDLSLTTLDTTEKRFLSVAVDGGTEMQPRIELARVPYAVSASSVRGSGPIAVDGAVSLGDHLTIEASEAGATPILDFGTGFGNRCGVLFRGNGSQPNRSLAFRLDQGATSTLAITESDYNPNINLRDGWTDLFVFQKNNLAIRPSASNATTLLEFEAGLGNKSGILFRGNGSQPNKSLALRFDQGANSSLTITQTGYMPTSDLRTDWIDLFTIESGGNVGIGTTSPAAKLDVQGEAKVQGLDVQGEAKVQVLEITGGADLAEPFPASDGNSFPAGALVVIDEKNPGKLKMSERPYDSRVAGIVSGAGGVRPGLTLSQQPITEGQNVALVGRVYALATVENGAIVPGDLLTTSSVAGHAMKATDRALSYGAVVGKAMSTLRTGSGLVLVLVQPR